MSTVDPYQSITKRNFRSAVTHLLETEYKLVGSHRILDLLAEDIEALTQEFYPTTERAASGSLIWTTTLDDGRKAQPGKRTEEYPTVTMGLPFVTADDLAEKMQACPAGQKRERGRQQEIQRMARMIKAGMANPGKRATLTQAELSVILNRSLVVIGSYIQEYHQQTGEWLPIKGYCQDQGAAPSHKGQIIELYEQGLEPPDIARRTSHDLKSVERYIKDYERVKLMLRKGLSITDIMHASGRGRKVVLQYQALAYRYHPELRLSSK